MKSLMITDSSGEGVDIYHSVHSPTPSLLPPPPFCWGGWTSYQIFKRGGLDRTSNLRGCWCKRGGNWKIWLFWGVYEKPISRGDYQKRGAWTVCRFKGGMARKRLQCFWGGWYPDAHYVFWEINKLLSGLHIQFSFKVSGRARILKI